MSILDLPIVAEYQDAIESSLDHAGTAGALDNLINTVRLIRQQGETFPNTAHDSAVDSAVRRIFVELIGSLEDDASKYAQLWQLIDVANALSDNDLSEPGLGFYLVEELLDSQTISGCHRVFDYLESRRERMVRRNFKSKHLVILRCCNELLRRLSRAEETVFCGRVFIYLFQTFPLGDRSSVNLRGVFHTENVTAFDDSKQNSNNEGLSSMDVDGETLQHALSEAQTPISLPQDNVDKTSRSTSTARQLKSDQNEPKPDLDALYPEFWSLQELFSDPTRLFEAKSMRKFKNSMSATLACFKYVSRSSALSAEPQESRRGVKRKRDDLNMEGTTSTTFNPKYLTSRDLFDLEIHDLAFRRHILVQALILIDFLLSLSPAGKARVTGLSNKSVLYVYTLTDEDTKWASSMRSSIASYLQQSGIGSEGSLYYRMVDTVLSRDKNWARWKAENCPPISRPAVSVDTFLAAQKSLQQATANKPMLNPPGASELAFLSRVEPLDSLENPSERHRVPTLEEYYKAIQGDELDMEMAMDEQERSEIEERKAGKLWRALRSATGRKFVLCEKIKNGDNLAALIDRNPDTKINGETDGDGDQEVKAEQKDGTDEPPEIEKNSVAEEWKAELANAGHSERNEAGT